MRVVEGVFTKLENEILAESTHRVTSAELDKLLASPYDIINPKTV